MWPPQARIGHLSPLLILRDLALNSKESNYHCKIGLKLRGLKPTSSIYKGRRVYYHNIRVWYLWIYNNDFNRISQNHKYFHISMSKLYLNSKYYIRNHITNMYVQLWSSFKLIIWKKWWWNTRYCPYRINNRALPETQLESMVLNPAKQTPYYKIIMDVTHTGNLIIELYFNITWCCCNISAQHQHNTTN